MEIYSNKIYRAVDELLQGVKVPDVIQAVLLFGSAVRNEVNVKSDIDVCVVLKSGNRYDSNNFYGFDALSREIAGIVKGVCNVDYVIGNLDDYLTGTKVYESIRREGVIIGGNLLELGR